MNCDKCCITGAKQKVNGITNRPMAGLLFAYDPPVTLPDGTPIVSGMYLNCT